MPSVPRLRLREVRGVLHLVGEIRNLGNDTTAWRTHALNELVRLLRGQVAMTVDMSGALPGQTPAPVAPLHVGWRRPEDGERYLAYLQRGEARDDPAAQALFRRLEGRILVTATRRELVSDEAWYAAPSVYEARRGAGIDDFVCSCARLDTGVLQGFIVYRHLGADSFGPRERNLLRLFHVELLRALRTIPERCEPGDNLPPRLREVMGLLARGASAKQVGRELGLSVHTVNSYCKALYRRLGVEGKAGLLARRLDEAQRSKLSLPPGLAHAHVP